RRTRERALGLAPGLLAAGEDASFESHDGLRISARLYLPSSELGYDGPWPLVYYVHGGPQSQERPNFAWFSMPLIQILALEGFAVFVPNVRGSSGYGLTYTKWVDRDWGGDDRLDHVHAMTEVLPRDPRLDVERGGVGRDVDYLVFEDEGHDVLKLPNRVRCYERIVGFFSEHLEAV